MPYVIVQPYEILYFFNPIGLKLTTQFFLASLIQQIQFGYKQTPRIDLTDFRHCAAEKNTAEIRRIFSRNDSGGTSSLI